MGSGNAREATQSRLLNGQISEVLTCGFAGGLHPNLQHGDVLWDADENFSLLPALKLSKSGSGQFLCAARIAVTAVEKARLRRETGADAVEMESGEIRALCRRHGIPSATIRVISDTADEDLPLDFNSLADAQQRMDYFKLARALLLNPGAIPRLMRFRNQITASAKSLGQFLNALLDSET